MNVSGPTFLSIFSKRSIFLRAIAMICVYAMLASTLPAQTAATSAPIATQSNVPVHFDMPKSHNPLNKIVNALAMESCVSKISRVPLGTR